MTISRRFFLKSGSLTAVAAAVALSPNARIFGQNRTQSTSSGYQIPISAQQEPTYMFRKSSFDPYVGGIFQAPDAQGRMVNLTLLSATTNKPSANTKISTVKSIETESFSLMFEAARALPEFTSIHQVSHPSLGTFDLFLTPHSQGIPLRYEAVFNHI
jgi:hypothetical protein